MNPTKQFQKQAKKTTIFGQYCGCKADQLKVAYLMRDAIKLVLKDIGRLPQTFAAHISDGCLDDYAFSLINFVHSYFVF